MGYRGITSFQFMELMEEIIKLHIPRIREKGIELHHLEEEMISYHYSGEFVNEVSEAIKRMDIAIKNDDMMNIENLAHDIKVKSSQADAFEIKDKAFLIELAARRGNLDKAVVYIEEMRRKIQEIK